MMNVPTSPKHKTYAVVNFEIVPFLGAFRYKNEWWIKWSSETARCGGNGMKKVRSIDFPKEILVGIVTYVQK